MKKKILIGSMLVLTLLLLMPSIPAIQQKTIEDKAYSDLVELESKYSVKENQQLDELYNSIYEKLVNTQSKDGDGITPPGLDFLVFLLEMLLFISSLIIERDVIPFIVAMIGGVLLLTFIFMYNVFMFTLFDIIDLLHDIIVFIKDLFNLPDNRLILEATT